MTQPRRIDSCPCGSGRKYKHCHGLIVAGGKDAVSEQMQEAAIPSARSEKPLRPASDHRLIVALGVPGSASTWVYNVAREAMIASHGEDGVIALYMDSIAQLLDRTDISGRRVVCKTHGVPQLPTLLHLAGAKVLISIRDPRDAVLSIVERFGHAIPAAVRGVEMTYNHALLYAAAGHPVLRYEDRFFERRDTVGAIARFIGAPIPAAEAARIFATYGTKAVRDFARNIPTLPADRLTGETPETRLDGLTHIHETHIGDGRIDKWRERLDPEQQADLTRRFERYLKAFRYPLTATEPHTPTS